MRRVGLRTALLVAALASLTPPAPASALVWPDAQERIERDLSSTDSAVRLLAVEQVESMGRGRAIPSILRSLADADPAVRIAAARVAVRVRAEGATASVLLWFSEPDARLRLAACEVARALPDERTVVPLARALGDSDATIRTCAADALGAQATREAVPPLLGKLEDANPTVRVEIIRALARLGDPRAVEPLMGKVEDSVVEVRQAVARALGDLGDPRAASALVLSLRDESPEIRVAALAALARVRGEEAVDVIGSLASQNNPTVRRAVLATLGALARDGSNDAVRLLTMRLGLDDDATLNLEATPVREALLSAGPRSIKPLVTILRGDPSPAAATSIAWVLGELGDRTLAPRIAEALRRGTLPPAAALHAFSGVGTPDDLPTVLEFVGDDSRDVRAQALAATQSLLDPAQPDGRPVEPLSNVLRSSKLSLGERVKVIALLGRTGAPRAAPIVNGLLTSHDRATKLAAIDALGALGPIGSDDALVGFLADPDPELRLHGALALSACGTDRARDAILRQLEDPSGVDRLAALTALGGILRRSPSPSGFEQLHRSLDLAAGGERDAILVALGHAGPIGLLQSLLPSLDADDRRSTASAVAGRPESIPLLRGLVRDADASVRAQAIWALGSAKTTAVLEDVVTAVRESSPGAADVGINAAGALGRLAARTKAPEATAALCRLLGDHRPLVRANAAAGLALAAARCGDGAAELALLADHSARVRAAAARVLWASPKGGGESGALAHCSATDRDADVAHLCARAKAASLAPPLATLAYVEGPTRSAPLPAAAYLVELADGLLHAGTSDRRGAFFDPETPAGPLQLRDATNLDD